MAKKTKKAKQISPPSKETALYHKLHQFVLPVATAATIVVVIFLAYFSFTNASLAPVYAGTIAITGNASQQELEKQIASSAKNYDLTIGYPDATRKTFRLSDAGISIDAASSSAKIKDHLKNSVLERLSWWQPIKLKLAIKTDKVKLANFIVSKATIVNEVQQDAALSKSPARALALKMGARLYWPPPHLLTRSSSPSKASRYPQRSPRKTLKRANLSCKRSSARKSFSA